MENSPFIVNSNISEKTEITDTTRLNTRNNKKYIVGIVIFVVIVICLIIILFTINTNNDTYVDKPVRSDTEADFDIETSFRQLSKLQEDYLNKLNSQRN